MTAAFGVQAKESRYKGGRTALARRIPPKKKEEKNIERPEGAMVYVSMNNFAGCIEGATVNTGASDLKSRNSERFDARLHGAGINDEENAGQRSNRGAPYGVSRGQEVARLMARVSPINMTPHCYRHHGNLCAEKGMHARSQQLYFGGGAVTDRKCGASKAGELMKCATPSPIFL
jgi:hypothetical protein